MTDSQSSNVEPFASFAALKSAHTELQSRYRKVLGEHSVHDETGLLVKDLFPEVKNFIDRGRATGALIDAEDERNASQTYLDHWISVLYRNGFQGKESAAYNATLADFNPDESPDLRDKPSPYLGLDAFQEQDYKNFFGRRLLVEEMVARFAVKRVLAVVGPSGSGKSSAVLAGLIPALKADALPGSREWRYCPPMVPGANPLANLALALGPPTEDAARWVERQVSLFSQDGEHLRKLVESGNGRPCVIVIDQFEEVFTLCHDKNLLNDFINNLMGMVGSDTHQHRIVLTLRSDYEEQLPRLESLYPLLRDNRVQVTPLSASDLRDAIEKPADNIGLKFEKGIVEKLVKEIVGEPAGLPLLQFTLLQLWNRRRRNRITWDVYERLGGPRQALTKTADEFYANLIPQEQSVTRKVLLRLAWAAEGIQVLRDRVRRRELHAEVGSSDQVDEVLKKLVNARLVRLTSDPLSEAEVSLDDQFEVAHEALIRNWIRLVEWLKQEHDILRQRILLRSAAQQWELHHRDPGGLLGGALLEEGLRYRRELSGLEAEFVDESKRFAEATAREKARVALEKEEAQKREVKQVAILAAERQRRIDQKTRATRWLAAMVALLSLALVSTLAASVYANSKAKDAAAQATEAAKQKDLATQQAIAAANEKTRATEVANKATLDRVAFSEYKRDEALRIADAAQKKQAEADKAKRDAIAATKLANDRLTILTDLTTKLQNKNTELDTAKANLASENEKLIRLNSELDQKNLDLKNETQKKVKALEAADEARKQAEGARDLAVDKQVEAEKAINRLENVIRALSAHAIFSSDGSKVITLSSDQRVPSGLSAKRAGVLSLQKMPVVLDLDAPAGDQKTAASDQKKAAATNQEALVSEQKIRVWDTNSQSLAKEISATNSVAAALSSDGKKVATVTEKGDVVITDVATEVELKPFPAVLANATKVEFSPDSKRLAILGQNGEAKVLDLKTREVVVNVKGSGRQIVDIAFSPNGQYLSTTDTAQENTLIKIGSNVQLQVPLATGRCRAFSLQVLQISPSPDLKSELSVGKECMPDGNSAWKLIMDVYARQRDGSFEQLAHVSARGEAGTDLPALQALAGQGLNDEQFRLIGEHMKQLAKESAALEGLDEQTRTTQLIVLSSRLFGQVVRDLGLGDALK
ncbi:MAG: hypothetical protein QOE77_1596 [Blastocatellia bacterium]|jgi:hypothetical protein|nr:hypothetical protein [Blastocatellia bacterium]